MSDDFVEIAQVERAAHCVNPVFRNTPQFFAGPLGEALGLRPLLKVETVNPIRCFKGRGTDFLARTATRGDVLVCASAGNLGQGLAYAGREHDLRIEVFAASTVNAGKLAAMRRLGARVTLVDGDFDVARQCAADSAQRHGWTLVEDGNDPPLAEGAATIAVELTAAGHRIDCLLVPAGNGSLACGVAARGQGCSALDPGHRGRRRRRPRHRTGMAHRTFHCAYGPDDDHRRRSGRPRAGAPRG